ncbi:MAG: TRAP transporter small permease [Candidatus Latescibacteria bacterium]|jgi:TRAP-type C4-dicarboxylate transport system permease small subunit|nr:TRAP transporter small permease [Candidatus Latescibacterota bacterium]MDP7449282.1 TRAP transporter small permease [Candidatus Latescibacterota bacterium]HJP30727.1 TRAP transporter small permease [Candidatus Latescibacterota bacterium]
MTVTAGRRSRLHRLEEGSLVLLVGVLLLLAFAQILLRNLFDVTWMWADPLVRHLVLWVSFLGALIATRDGRHIHIDAVLRLLPTRVRRIAVITGDAVAAIVCMILTRLAVRFVIDEHDYGDQAFLDLPRWTLQLVFPLVFGGMTLRFASRVTAGIRQMLATGRRR